MLSYTYRSSKCEEAFFAHVIAQVFVASIPTHLQTDGEEIRCHELARATARVITRPDRWAWTGFLRLTVEDGRFCPWQGGLSIDHSWIEIVDSAQHVISFLDVYAIGRMPQVQLIQDDMRSAYRFTASYYVGAKREDIRHDVVEWLLTFAPDDEELRVRGGIG